MENAANTTIETAEPPSGGASVRWESERDVAIVEAWGEIDLSNVEELQAILTEAAEADIALIVDLTRVEYMDSSGFGTLLETSRNVRPLGVTVYLAGCSESIERMLEVTRLNTMFIITPTVETARTAIADLTSLAPTAP